MELAQVVGLSRSIQSHVRVREGGQGWSESQVITSLVLLNLAGGECVDDLRILEKYEGFCGVFRAAETHGMRRRERRALDRRWRKDRCRSVPSPSAVFRYLEMFHDEAEENRRQAHTAFIPAANQALSGPSPSCDRMLVIVIQESFDKRHSLNCVRVYKIIGISDRVIGCHTLHSQICFNVSSASSLLHSLPSSLRSG